MSTWFLVAALKVAGAADGAADTILTVTGPITAVQCMQAREGMKHALHEIGAPDAAECKTEEESANYVLLGRCKEAEPEKADNNTKYYYCFYRRSTL